MLIKSIYIEGFGPYQAGQTIDFGNEQIIGIHGPNGSGKTFLLEATLACLYETFPSRKGSIYNHLNGPKGTLKVTFEIEGETYTAERTVQAKPQKQEAFLYRNNNLIAGPKTTDFLSEIERLLGPAESALASIFSAQNSTGDIVNLSPSERKELLGSWLGLEALSGIAQAATDKAKAHKMRLDDIEANIKALEKEEAHLAEYVSALKQKEEELKQKTREAEETNRQLQAACKEKTGIEEAVRRTKELSARLQVLSREREEIKNQYIKVKSRLDEIQKLLGKKEEIETKVKQYEEITQQARREYDTAHKLQKEHQEYQDKRRRLEKEIHIVRESVAVLKTQKETYEKQAATIDEAKCSRRDCKFLTEAWKARDRLPGIKQKLAEEHTRLAKLTADLQRLRQPQPIDPLLANIKIMEKAAKELEIYVKLAAQLSTAEKERAYLAEELDRLTEKGKEKTSEMENISRDLEKFTMALGQSEVVEKQVALFQNRGRKLSADSLSLSQDIGEIKAKIQATVKIQHEILSLKERRGELASGMGDYEAIARIYGKNGVQPLLIDAAMPELEALARGFLASICGRKFDVSFTTQRETNKGKGIKETLDIIIADLTTGQKRDIANFSGGEKVVLSQAIRMAMSVFQAQKSRKPWQTFFLDESLGELDEINAEKFLKAITELTAWFSRVLYISHSRDLTTQAKRQVKVQDGIIDGLSITT